MVLDFCKRHDEGLILSETKSRASHSQLGQDLWIVSIFANTASGFFVEAGAGDGVEISNTLLLEQRGWNGLCVEPSPRFARLIRNRTCRVANACLGRLDGETLPFHLDQHDSHYSGIHKFLDDWQRQRAAKTFDIATVSLGTLLRKYNAPRFIEYLSLDTEGSELEILRGLDFSEFSFGALTIEHNWEEPRRRQTRNLLQSKGYLLFKEVEFEDWFLNRIIARSPKQGRSRRMT